MEPSDDAISAVFVLGPAARNGQTRGRSKGAPLVGIVESWSTLTHRMPSTPVGTATRNATGGWDYYIGRKGLPERLCAARAEAGCFPSAAAPEIAAGKWGADFWAHPADIGPTRSPVLDANPGAVTTVNIEGYRCQSQVPGDACTMGFGLWGPPPGRGVSNLVLQVVTDAQRRVRTVTGYWTVEYRLNAGPPAMGGEHGENNSWYGGFLRATAVQPSDEKPVNLRLPAIGPSAPVPAD